MENSALRYYPGVNNPRVTPLARFLPPLPAGMVSAWLKDNVPAGAWILDPLGASPALILEAARAGYRVLVACNNPILSFMVDMLAKNQPISDFQAALAELSMSKRADERLETHIKNLYLTECESCRARIPAQAFLWRKGEKQPYGRLYHCTHCNDSPTGERPIAQFDLDRLSAMGDDRMQRVRALQRVLMNDEEHRGDVEEALENYMARPLYVLFTLINKIEGLGQSSEKQRLLRALLLSAFDSGNTLWSWPAGRSRPRQLSTPPQFRENNLWLALEEAAGEWSTPTGRQPDPVIISHWPDLPNSIQPGQGAICLFHGRVKTLIPLPEGITPKAVAAVYPRPSQAFWTLSVLWSGWLWGPEATLPIRNVLDRRRYDWNWHTSAIFSALSGVGANLTAETPFFGLMPELAPGFLSAVMCANEAAGFQLDGFALRSEDELAQMSGRIIGRSEFQAQPGKVSPPPTSQALEKSARLAIQAELEKRGEPAPYGPLYAVGMQALISNGLIPRNMLSLPGDILTRVQTILAHTFADRSFLQLISGPSEESGWWWLASQNKPTLRYSSNSVMPGTIDPGRLPLSDQIEIEFVRFAQKQSLFTPFEMDQLLCRNFPGLLTPSLELINTCIESYAEVVPDQPGVWQLRSGETTTARRADLLEVHATLTQVGRHLGYKTFENGNSLVWQTDTAIQNPPQGEWRFFCIASSIISRFVLTAHTTPPERCVLVLPGSRARLLRMKLNRDPHLAKAALGWHFLKYRHLREIAARPEMSLTLWEALLEEDPLTEDAHQMHLFS